jgi:S-formylglutathione hydrolase FrmB
MLFGCALVAGCSAGSVKPGPVRNGGGGTGVADATGGSSGSSMTTPPGAAGAAGVVPDAGALGGAAGSAPTGAAGSSGPAGSGGPASSSGAAGMAPAPDAGASDAHAADPGTDGDGMRTLPGPFHAAPEFTRAAGVPQGKLVRFTMDVASTIYAMAPTTRKIAVYVPAQYKAGAPAPVLVVQDGTDFYGFDGEFPPAFDSLIAKGAIPPMVAVFAGNGGGDYIGSERGLEYDTVSGLYAEWVETELFPRVEAETKAQLPAQAVTITKDPEGRAALGGSSGGAASFSMAWWHPDLFRRVITFSGTYVDQVAATSPFPHGCWVYHDEDPYDDAGPNGLIVAHCEPATNPGAGSSNPGPCDTPLSRAACEAVAGCAWNTAVNKPLRVWLEAGSNDDGAGQAPSTHRNFDLANQRMFAALQQRGYHVHFDQAIGAGHVDQGPIRQTLPEALTWLWRGYTGP